MARLEVSTYEKMKGHRERVMIYNDDHTTELSEQSIGEAYILLLAHGRSLFSNSRFWTIMEPAFATVPSHWHRVASDLDPRAEDHEQILKTPRLVIDNETLDISREGSEATQKQQQGER